MNRQEWAQRIIKENMELDDDIIFGAALSRHGGDREDEPIKLLFCNREAVEQEIFPCWIPAFQEYPQMVIIEVSPKEFRMLKLGHLQLPEGWDFFFCAGGIDLNNGGSISAHLDWSNKQQMEEWKRNCEWVLDWMKKNNEAQSSGETKCAF